METLILHQNQIVLEQKYAVDWEYYLGKGSLEVWSDSRQTSLVATIQPSSLVGWLSSIRGTYPEAMVKCSSDRAIVYRIPKSMLRSALVAVLGLDELVDIAISKVVLDFIKNHKKPSLPTIIAPKQLPLDSFQPLLTSLWKVFAWGFPTKNPSYNVIESVWLECLLADKYPSITENLEVPAE